VSLMSMQLVDTWPLILTQCMHTWTWWLSENKKFTNYDCIIFHWL